MIYFTADTHFSHKNVLKYEDRPFTTIEEMDSKLIENWNRRVQDSDDIYILGDLLFGNGSDAETTIKRLNGRKHLIRGNHDSFLKGSFDKSLFVWIKDYYVLRHEKQKFVMFHYPIAVWDCKHHGAIHLYGHVHSNKDNHHPLLVDLEGAYNVGVDVNNYEPISIDEVLKKINDAK